ncbi:hypothetical protein [Planomicrobium sp. CPCC 101110]|nr:hypothetical protein [Planomicrobium sp. CPCC 101110]
MQPEWDPQVIGIGIDISEAEGKKEIFVYVQEGLCEEKRLLKFLDNGAL